MAEEKRSKVTREYETKLKVIGSAQYQAKIKAALRLLDAFDRRTGRFRGAGGRFVPTRPAQAAVAAGAAAQAQEKRLGLEAAVRAERSVARLARAQTRAAAAAAMHATRLRVLNNRMLILNTRLFRGTKTMFDMFIQFRSITTSLMVFVGVITAATLGIKSFIDAALGQQSAMAGLEQVAKSTGRDFSKVKQILNDVVQGGYLPLMDAATGLKNLLLIQKLSTEDAGRALWNLIAAASANRKTQQSMGQQVNITTQGLRDMLSQATDAVGVGKNLDIIVREMAEAAGLHAASLSFEEKQLLGVLGFIKETEKFLPLLTDAKLDAVRAAMKLQAQWQLLKITLGEALMPVAVEFMEHLLNIVRHLRKITSANEKAIAAGFIPFIRFMLAAVKAVVQFTIALARNLPWIAQTVWQIAKWWVAITLLGKVLLLAATIVKAFTTAITKMSVIVNLAKGNILGLAASIIALIAGIAIFHTLKNEAKELGDELKKVEKQAKTMQAALPKSLISAQQQAGVVSPAAPATMFARVNNYIDIDDEQLTDGFRRGLAMTRQELRDRAHNMETELSQHRAAIRII